MSNQYLDYMAGQALQGLLAQRCRSPGDEDTVAGECYRHAEAMLREEQRRNTIPGNEDKSKSSFWDKGVTQLDYMAGMALQGLLANRVHSPGNEDALASDCYDHAEAMLKEKQKLNTIPGNEDK